jgi:trehalose 6-phosphate synthase
MRSDPSDGGCSGLPEDILTGRELVIVSNRGPFSLYTGEDGALRFQRGSGGLVTALLGLAGRFPSTWIASAASDEDRAWKEGEAPLTEESGSGDSARIRLRFIDPTQEAYEGYYQVISNPLLWFLQHSIWDFAQSPTINQATWRAWEEGYVQVNRLFADAVVAHVRGQNSARGRGSAGGHSHDRGTLRRRRAIVMLQDYHLYLAPRMIRAQIRRPGGPLGLLLTHFIHIPWPGPEDWGMLPARMREPILSGLCAVDLLGFQTRGDSLNFIRTCESLLPGAQVNYRRGTVTLQNRVTHVRDFPISIDVDSVHEQCRAEETRQYHAQLDEMAAGRKVILRIDRTEPSKNIVRGFQAYDEMLETHPEHRGAVQFWALLVPSRLEVEEYQDYINAIMSAAGAVNVKHGTSDWEPVRVLVGESYPRALAALQRYDVLLVNPVADGMNLVAKEGPTVNERDGVLVLSERAGAHQQLGAHALVVSPCDISATADALHQALTMPAVERQKRAAELRASVEREDIHAWMCWQLDEIQELLQAQQAQRARDKAGRAAPGGPAAGEAAQDGA